MRDVLVVILLELRFNALFGGVHSFIKILFEAAGSEGLLWNLQDNFHLGSLLLFFHYNVAFDDPIVVLIELLARLY